MDRLQHPVPPLRQDLTDQSPDSHIVLHEQDSLGAADVPGGGYARVDRFHRSFDPWQGDLERRAPARFAVHPDVTAPPPYGGLEKGEAPPRPPSHPPWSEKRPEEWSLGLP